MADIPFGEGSVADLDRLRDEPPSVEPIAADIPEEQDEPDDKPEQPQSVRDALIAALGTKDASSPGSSTAASRPRDDQGKFIKADDAAKGAPADQQSPETTGAKPQEGQPAVASEAPPAVAGPPPGWSSEAKAVYSQLPPAVQQAVIKREQEVSAGFAQYAARQKDFEQIVGPRRQYYADQGVSDIQAVDNIWQWFEALKNSPAQAFPALAKTFGYDLSTVAQPNGQGVQQPSQIDPALASVRDQVGQLGQSFQTIMAEINAEREGKVRDEIDAFAKSHPHFERVRVSMGRIWKAGEAEGLEDAYQKAVWANPEIRQELMREEAAKATAANLNVQPRTTPKAAAVSPKSASPAGAAKTQPSRSIREELRSAMNGG